MVHCDYGTACGRPFLPSDRSKTAGRVGRVRLPQTPSEPREQPAFVVGRAHWLPVMCVYVRSFVGRERENDLCDPVIFHPSENGVPVKRRQDLITQV